MVEQSGPYKQYYRSLPLAVELWLLDGLINLNQDDSIDALGWPWFGIRDMRILLNRIYLAKLTVHGVDCNILNQGEWKYAWTIIWEDYVDPSLGREYITKWFFKPFEEKIQQLAQKHLLDRASFTCTITMTLL